MSAEHLALLTKSDSMLNTVTIALITWAIAVTIAIVIMVTVIVHRVRRLRAKARRIQGKRRPGDSESPPSSAASVDDVTVDMQDYSQDGDGDCFVDEEFEEMPEVEAARPSSSAAALANRLAQLET